MSTAAEALAEAVRRLRAGADELAAGVAPLDRPPPGWSGVATQAADASRTRLAAQGRALGEAVRTLAAAVGRAAGDEATVAAALTTALGATPGTPTPDEPPPAGLDPEAVARWWAGLGPAQREALVRERPALVGGLDGVPARDRDRANRRALDDTTGAAAARLAALVLAAAASPAGTLRDLAAPRAVSERLAGLAGVRRASDVPGRALLLLEETPGRPPLAAVALGDVDTAAHVGVYTSGFTTSSDDLGEQLGELSTVRAQAGPGTATVAWDGYDPPQWPEVADPERSVLSRRPADDAAPRLARFLGGLDAARSGAPAHLTAIGHSYGSLTTAAAVARAPGVDDAVYLGSPGIGSAPGPRGHTWVAEAAGDAVADAGWFGPDPNRMPGTTGLSTREVVGRGGVVTVASTGHREYLAAGTTSAANVADVVGGRPDAAVLDRGVGTGDRVRELFGG